MARPELWLPVHEGRYARRCGPIVGVEGGLLAMAGSAFGQCTPVWTGLGLEAGGANGLATVWGLPGLNAATHVAAGGGLVFPGDPTTYRVGLWDGWAWRVGLGAGFNGTVQDIAAPTQGQGSPGVHLFAGGTLESAGGVPSSKIAEWTAGAWSEPGAGLSGTAQALFWCPAPGPLGPALYAGGQFTQAGGVSAKGLARWSGITWSDVGGGVAPAIPGQGAEAKSFELYDDDGPGPRQEALYVGGSFKFAGGVPADGIARWDGVAWEPLAGGSETSVRAICVFDTDGPGPIRDSLFAGGPGVNHGGLTRWDGAAWHPVPGWIGNSPHAMVVFDDDGPGPNKPSLFVGGLHVAAMGVPVNSIARWDGQSWTQVGSGISLSGGGGPWVDALAVFDEDGIGPNPGGLYVGGYFIIAGAVPTVGIARWGCPLPPACYANCNRDAHPVTGAHVLTIADFACFQTRYVLQDPSADCTADSLLTVADFACFQSRFVAGCP